MGDGTESGLGGLGVERAIHSSTWRGEREVVTERRTGGASGRTGSPWIVSL